jgi:hypothetical protein
MDPTVSIASIASSQYPTRQRLTSTHSTHALGYGQTASDPLNKLTEPPVNESPEARNHRLQIEQEAARVSAEIDAKLLEDAKKEEWRKKALKILLLGEFLFTFIPFLVDNFLFLPIVLPQLTRSPSRPGSKWQEHNS